MAPLISIITPSYNQADYLEQTMRSVLGQDYPQIEYLVIDGGSTDGSAELIERYADRLAYWVSEADSGQAEAINKGFGRAQGTYIAWLNSDDMYAPGAVAKAVAALEAAPELGMVYGDALSIDAQGRPFNRQSFQPYTLADLLAFNIICQPAVFMRRSALDRAGGMQQDFHYLLDHHLWIRIAQDHAIQHIPEILAYPRYHAEAKNLTGGEAFGNEAFRIIDWLPDQPGLAALAVQTHSRSLAGAHRLKAHYLLDVGRAWPALKHYLQVLRHNPAAGLAEWRRLLFALVSVFGLQRLGGLYYRLRPKPPGAAASVHIESVKDI